jgi:predicted dehydrogenase
VSAVLSEIKINASNVLGVGIIGCGLIGKKRAASLGVGGRLIACADIDLSRAEELAQRFGVLALSNWQTL